MRPRILSAVGAVLCAVSNAGAADYWMYVGTRTGTSSRGIYGYRFDSASGKLQRAGLMAATPNPSFLVVHPDNRYIYTVNEDPAGTVSSFLIDPRSGKLSLVNRVASEGDGPAHLALDRSGRYVAVANYDSGSVVVFPLRTDGGLGTASAFIQHRGSSRDPVRQSGPHARCVLFSPDNRFLMVADLGADKIVIYRFDAMNGSLSPAEIPSVSVPAGAGVRCLAFHPNGQVLYALNELVPTVTAYQYDAKKGVLQEFQTTSVLPEAYKGGSAAAEIAVNAAGTVLYASVGGPNILALLRIDPLRFALSEPEITPLIGQTPRRFTFDPTGRFLLAENENSDAIMIYTVHPRTGQIQPAGRPVTGAAKPSCIVFVPVQ